MELNNTPMVDINLPDNKLTIVNFKIPRENFVYSNEKRASIKIGDGQLSVATRFIYAEDDKFASVGIVKEWDYYYSTAPKQGQEVKGEAIIKSLSTKFTILPPRDAFTIATKR